MPLFLTLTSLGNRPVLINMSLVWKIAPSNELNGSIVHAIGENMKIFVKEAPDEILQMMYIVEDTAGKEASDA